MATNEYKTFLSENKVLSSGNSREAALVDRVGGRIANAISKYYDTQENKSVLEGYKWEFNTIDDRRL